MSVMSTHQTPFPGIPRSEPKPGTQFQEGDVGRPTVWLGAFGEPQQMLHNQEMLQVRIQHLRNHTMVLCLSSLGVLNAASTSTCHLGSHFKDLVKAALFLQAVKNGGSEGHFDFGVPHSLNPTMCMWLSFSEHWVAHPVQFQCGNNKTCPSLHDLHWNSHCLLCLMETVCPPPSA